LVFHFCGRTRLAHFFKGLGFGCGYNLNMNEMEFRRRADAAIEDLKQSLIRAENQVDMEAEENAGALHISFDDPPGKFVITPNAPVAQIWISALVSSFKLDWSESVQGFVLSKTGERLKDLVGRLIGEQLGEQVQLT
jgi:CyaY protein